jgi:chromate transport protein ChrA|tara:strand:+ start:500 stop:730 length:231 start_codon:yes stop_codon:yes gene_type:complete
MSRLMGIIGIWVAGFSLGFIGYLAYPGISQMAVSIIPSLMSLDSQIVGAMVAGMASSFITVLAVTIWAYSRPTNSL